MQLDVSALVKWLLTEIWECDYQLKLGQINGLDQPIEFDQKLDRIDRFQKGRPTMMGSGFRTNNNSSTKLLEKQEFIQWLRNLLKINGMLKFDRSDVD